jgi:hypothetical protein
LCFVVGAVMAVLPGAGSGIGSVSAQPVDGAQQVSAGVVNSFNWSGYAVSNTATTFSQAEADWTQPTVAPGSCPKQKLQLGAFFVGIDGFGSSSVEQVGTEADCISGNPVYYAWYEMYPAPLVILGCAVKAGDAIHGGVEYNSGTSFTLTLTVNGHDCLPPGTVNAPALPARASAEWIAEAPATGGHFWPLTDFQQLTFTHASATGGGVSGVIDSAGWNNDALTMVDRGRPFSPTVNAAPGLLNGTGDGFTITWNSN